VVSHARMKTTLDWATFGGVAQDDMGKSRPILWTNRNIGETSDADGECPAAPVTIDPKRQSDSDMSVEGAREIPEHERGVVRLSQLRSRSAI
jgi:hypothetical protein